MSNSNTRHTLFVKAQEAMKQKVLELERNVPTRWFYWYKSIKKIMMRYEAIQAVLITLISTKDNSHQPRWVMRTN